MHMCVGACVKEREVERKVGRDVSSLSQPTAHYETSQEALVSEPGASQSFQKDLKIENLWVVFRQEEDSFQLGFFRKFAVDFLCG